MTLEADAVVQVLLRERLRIAAVATLIVRDVHAADDIFQQVVLSALENRGQLRDGDHLLAWALRAARHRAIDLARKRSLRPLPDDVLDLLESPWIGPAGREVSDQVEALHRCLGKLAEPARDLLRMKYDDGLSTMDIAARMRRTVDAVYQNLSRIHRALRECVRQETARLEAVACPVENHP
jgi:RNA polymerase sigma-70 factor (ECF subfamily)